jgi:RNA polymerase sigma factor (sigma-70 family)
VPLARRRIENPADHDSAVQYVASEVLLVLQRSRPDHPAALYSWMKSVARRKLAEFCAELASTDAETPVSEVPDTRTSDCESDTVERRLDVAAAIRRLPPEQRHAIGRRYLLEWRVKEIAEFVGRPEGTISARIHRALNQLKNDPAIQAWGDLER